MEGLLGAERGVRGRSRGRGRGGGGGGGSDGGVYLTGKRGPKKPLSRNPD